MEKMRMKNVEKKLEKKKTWLLKKKMDGQDGLKKKL